jgi:hypothetical protein
MHFVAPNLRNLMLVRSHQGLRLVVKRFTPIWLLVASCLLCACGDKPWKFGSSFSKLANKNDAVVTRFRAPWGDFNTNGETYLFVVKLEAARRRLAGNLRSEVCADTCPGFEQVLNHQSSGDFVLEGPEVTQYLTRTSASESMSEFLPAREILKSLPTGHRDMVVLVVIHQYS